MGHEFLSKKEYIIGSLGDTVLIRMYHRSKFKIEKRMVLYESPDQVINSIADYFGEQKVFLLKKATKKEIHLKWCISFFVVDVSVMIY